MMDCQVLVPERWLVPPPLMATIKGRTIFVRQPVNGGAETVGQVSLAVQAERVGWELFRRISSGVMASVERNLCTDHSK